MPKDVKVDRKLFVTSYQQNPKSNPLFYTSSRQFTFLANAVDCVGSPQHIPFSISGAREQLYFSTLRSKHLHTV